MENEAHDEIIALCGFFFEEILSKCLIIEKAYRQTSGIYAFFHKTNFPKFEKMWTVINDRAAEALQEALRIGYPNSELLSSIDATTLLDVCPCYEAAVTYTGSIKAVMQRLAQKTNDVPYPLCCYRKDMKAVDASRDRLATLAEKCHRSYGLSLGVTACCT